MQLAETERKRRSDQARRLAAQRVCSCGQEFDSPESAELHARETGHEVRRKFGGAQPGSGRPRKPRASEHIAKKVGEESEALWTELKALRQDKSSAVRLKAILTLLDVEERERLILVDEERELEKMRKDELVAWVLETLEELRAKGVIPDVIDGEASEVAGELNAG